MDKTPTQMPSGPTVKHHLITAAISAGIVLIVILLIWIPFKLIPALFSSGSNYVATSLSSTFLPATSSSQTSQPTTQMTAPAGNSYTAPSTANTAPAYVAPAPSYYGLPDLAVSLIGTGILNSAGQFVETPYAGTSDTVAIKFEVRNIGTNVSGQWQLQLNMPSITTPYYTSAYQQSIRPGDAIEFTASFTNPVTTGINMAYITADPNNMIAESDEANNSITVPIDISGVSYENYYGNNVYAPAYTPAVTYNAPQTTVPYGTTYTWTDINANCYANPQTVYPGGAITWTVAASGGNGYFSYNWSGTDGLIGTSNTVTQTYYSAGSVIANVSVTSNGQTITKQCSAYVY